jgi:hypothetical protein
VIVDDPALADVELEVGFTLAWDYPFHLKHQNSTMVLRAGKGYGTFPGPLGVSVGWEFVQILKRSRGGNREALLDTGTDGYFASLRMSEAIDENACCSLDASEA